MTVDRRTVLLASSGVVALAVSSPSKSASPELKDAASRERVDGIGGLFFRCHEPKKLAEWYQRHLGIDPIPTDYNKKPWQQQAGPTAFAPFPMDTDYFGAQQAFMLNFRVRNLDAMATQLRADGVTVDVDPKSYPNGRFARLHDLEGNAIELWEPAPR